MRFLRSVGAASRKAGSGGSGSGRPPEDTDEDAGGFGPPGGMVWTTPVDVLTDIPKNARPAAVEDRPAASRPAPTPAASSSTLGLLGLQSADISATAEIAGFVGACLVDSDTGLMLASQGDSSIDMEAEAALNTQVVKAQLEAIETLQLEDQIEDILITTGRQLHMIHPLEKVPTMFLYVALDKKSANLGIARMQVKKIESSLTT